MINSIQLPNSKEIKSESTGKKRLLSSIKVTPINQRKKGSFRVTPYMSGGAIFQDSNYVMERMSTRSYLNDKPETIKKLSTVDTASRTNDANERKKYFEEILNFDTKQVDSFFKERFKKNGALLNLGKLMSDKMKNTLSWKRSFDPRHPGINHQGARARARLRFEGWYNEGLLWGNPLEYKEGTWYDANKDGPYKAEVQSLYRTDLLGHVITSSGILKETNYMNYHFNLGLGFGESQVFNPPFQYNDLDDPRTHPRYTKIGRVYVQKVLNHMPIVMIMPGKIKYNVNALTLWGIDFGATKSNVEYIRSDNWFTTLISAAWMGVTDIVGTTIAFATSIFTGGKMITFRQQINLFQKYFDNTATSLANNMGLISPTGMYHGRWKLLSLTHIQPGIALQRGGYSNFLGMGWRSNQMIAFMTGKNISCSETISASTRPNPLMEQLNAESSESSVDSQTGGFRSTSDIAKNMVNAALTGDMSGVIRSVGSFGSKIAMGVAGLVSQMALVKSGGARIDLPDVWDSSSFSRSYNLSFEAHSPYGHPLCKMETWGIQLAFWLTAALPRQVGSFSYVEPFVHRIVMPGKFNLNFAIIESLGIERGDDINDWSNTDNLPKTVKFNITLKDFQPSILLPQASRSVLKLGYETLFPASGFAEYLATVSGLSLSDQMDWKRRFGRAFRDFGASIRRKVNADIIAKTVYNFNPVQNILNIFRPYTDAYDRVEVLEDRARQKEYSMSGLEMMKNKILKGEFSQGTAHGLDSGSIFTFPLRWIARTVYRAPDSISGLLGLVKATGKILKPRDTQGGFEMDEDLKELYSKINNDTNAALFTGYGVEGFIKSQEQQQSEQNQMNNNS